MLTLTSAQKISLLNQTTLKCFSTPDKTLIAKHFTRSALKILGGDFGFMWFKDRSGDYSLAYKSPNLPYNPIPPRKHGINKRADKTRNPQYLEKIPYQDTKYDVSAYMSSFVIIPITYQNRMYGNAVICFKKPKKFSAEDKSLCVAVGNAIAQALTINRLVGSLAGYKKIIDSTSEALLVLDPQTKAVLYCNPASQRYAPEGKTHADTHISEIFSSLNMEMLSAAIKKTLQENTRQEFESTITNPQRTVLQIAIEPLRNSPWGTVVVLLVHNITERKKTFQKIKRLAYYDRLTSMPNRMHFEEDLVAEVETARKNSQTFSLILIDLDRFKFINDSLGHREGDRVLQETGKRLKKCIRSSDSAYRIGGDEYAIIIRDQNSKQAAVTVCETILRLLEMPMEVGAHEVYSTASIGLGFYPTDGKDFDTLLRHTDYALYLAKEAGGNTYMGLPLNSTDVKPQDNWQLDADLRKAISRNEFVFYYQPIFTLSEPHTTTQLEAILRWNHPKRGLVMPVAFHKYLEASGLIVGLTEWQFNQACEMILNLRAVKLEIPICINISARQLLQQNFFQTVTFTLQKHDIDPSLIKLELTETLLIKNLEASQELLAKFRSLGFRVMVDDFGTGYASLNYLKDLRVDGIKIDRSYIQHIHKSPMDLAIVRALIFLCTESGLELVAEGVETTQQKDILLNAGANLAQGYLYSEPLAAEKCIEMITKKNKKKTRE
ncbi:MAG TPA: EAL domain-containing protein [Patescibacteria group bacterium]|nr:EAL domain-containing protein [Patescibacteria group bacterium]